MDRSCQFHYSVFGLNIASDVEFPELQSGIEGDIDVQIHVAPIPDRYVENENWAYFWRATPDYFYYSIKEMCRYLVTPNSIIIEILQADIDIVSEYLFGICFGILLQIKGILPLHGSCVSTEQGAVLFLGPSGIGKSTIVAGLASRGYPVLTDDICAISFDSRDQPMISPGYPRIKLTRTSREKSRFPLNEYHTTTSNKDKGVFNLNQLEASRGKVALHSTYILATHTVASFSIEPLQGITGFTNIQRNIYGVELTDELATTSNIFEQIMKVIDRTNIFLFNRPDDTFHLDKMLEYFLKHRCSL